MVTWSRTKTLTLGRRRSVGWIRWAAVGEEGWAMLGHSSGSRWEVFEAEATWVVAGTLAYFLWVKPSQDLRREQEAKTLLAASYPNRYVEMRKPIPDPQETGLIYGNKNKGTGSEE